MYCHPYVVLITELYLHPTNILNTLLIQRPWLLTWHSSLWCFCSSFYIQLLMRRILVLIWNVELDCCLLYHAHHLFRGLFLLRGGFAVTISLTFMTSSPPASAFFLVILYFSLCLSTRLSHCSCLFFASLPWIWLPALVKLCYQHCLVLLNFHISSIWLGNWNLTLQKSWFHSRDGCDDPRIPWIASISKPRRRWR